MKKLLAILLAGVMSATVLSFNVSAAETNEKTDAEIQREKLGWLVKAMITVGLEFRAYLTDIGRL